MNNFLPGFIITLSLLLFPNCDSVKLSSEEESILSEIEFDRSIALELKQKIKSNFKKFEHGLDSSKKANAICFSIPQSLTGSILNSNYDSLKKRGYIIFISEMNFGNKYNLVSILKTEDQFEILKYMRSDGVNQGISNEMIISKLKLWNKIYPFNITGAGANWVELKFISKHSDMLSFAKEIYQFCPDVVDQGTGSVEELSEEMEEKNILFLWWD